MSDVDVISIVFLVFISMIGAALAYDFLKDLIRQIKRDERVNHRNHHIEIGFKMSKPQEER